MLPPTARRPSALTLAAAVCLLTAGCAAPARRPAVPDALADRAIIPALGNIRTWSDEVNSDFLNVLTRSVEREQELLTAAGHTGPLPPADFLAISGGGANGAYGAGLLCGWTETGTRPTFKVVTGISTGALTAPFAFLGPEYDAKLKELYTGVRTSDILERRALLAGLLGDALTDNAPLWRLLKKSIDDEVLAAVAAEYRKGRLLLVATTDLDAQRGVIWNMGAIADSGQPGALELFHSIMIASAAIPAAFPPVMIDVEVDGQAYQEMHVDGGAMAQVFLYPPSLQLSKAAHVERVRRAHIIRNSRLDPDWAQVERRTLSIAGRAISALIQTQGVGDLYRLYLTTQRDGVDFNLSCIPTEFSAKPREEFDPEYMRQLFDVGYQRATSGTAWLKAPPGFSP